MDPLSATLVAISLATALKDIVKTARAIQDSFAKLPRNFRNARKLADEVFTTLQEMQEIYDDNIATFDETKHLKNVVNALRVQMKSVHEQCLGLIPPTNEKKRDKFKIAFYAFWNREKLEELISELKDQVDRRSQQFLVLSSLRTEALVVEMHGRYENGSLGVPAGHLVEFTHSLVPMPTTRIADAVPAHDLSKAYLRREIGVVDRSFQSAFSYWARKFPSEFEIPPLITSWFLKATHLPDTQLHKTTVSLAFHVQSLLENSPNSLWIRGIDRSINQLAINLCDLLMIEDAIAIGTLRVNFWKAMVAKYPKSATALHHLAVSLTHLAIYSNITGDREQTYRRSTEAMKTIESFSDTKIDYIELLGRNVVLQSNVEKDSNIRALELAIGAGKMLEIGHDILTSINSPTMAQLSSALRMTSPPAVNNLSIWGSNVYQINIDQNISHDSQFTTASTFITIAKIQLNHNQLSESNRLCKAALATLKRLLGIYPGSGRILEEIRHAYTHLWTCRPMRELNSVTENLEYAQDNASIIRELALINPQKYVLQLLSALSSQREIFLNAGKLPEAQKVYQDMSSLGDLAAAPDHFDLHIPSEIEGDYYYQVAQFHMSAQRLTDAIHAAQKAVVQYSALEFMNPGRSRTKHLNALLLVCKSSISAKRYETALAAGFEALKIIDNSINIRSPNSNLVESYHELLGGMMESLAASQSTNPTMALSHAKDIDARIRSISRFIAVESKWKAAHAPVKYAELLEKSALIEEAASYLQDVYNNWQEIYGGSDSNIAAIRYIQCLKKLLAILKNMGETEQALKYNDDARQFIQRFQSKLGDNSHSFFASASLSLIAMRINLLCDVGRYTEALDLSSNMTSEARSRSLGLEDATRGIVTALFFRSLMQSCNNLPYEAINTATEAISLCRDRLPTDKSSNLYSLYESQIVLCHALHDIGSVDEALRHLEEAEKAAMRMNMVYSTEGLKNSQSDGSYGAILTMRSKLLFAKGNYLEAANLIKRVEIVQRESCKSDKMALRNMTKTLHYSGIVYCTLGRDEEGLAAVTELKGLKENISIASPNLARVIQIGMDYMTKRGSWKSVQYAKDRLKCNHQHEY